MCYFFDVNKIIRIKFAWYWRRNLFVKKWINIDRRDKR